MTSETRQVETGSLRVADVSFSYLDAGAGESAIVFLHGIGSGARSWTAQVEALSQRSRVVAWDAPGYGSSTGVAPAKPDASDYVERLTMLADALGLHRIHVVGHSLGAVIATRFASEHRSRVASLTLASPSSGQARLAADERERLRRSRLDDLDRLGPVGLAELRGPRLVSPDASDVVRAAVVETMSRIRPAGYAQAVEMLAGANTLGDLVALDPSLAVQFILGELDVITPRTATVALAAGRPQAQVHTLEGCGHALYLERPTEFNRLITNFVASAETHGRA